MKEIFLLKEGEIVLKGLNKKTFEDVLLKNIKTKLKTMGDFLYTPSQSTIAIKPLGEVDMDEVERRIKTVYGIAAYLRAVVCEKKFDAISRTTIDYLSEDLKKAQTFKVEAKRADKKFDMISPEIEAKMGEILLSEYKNLKVDVKKPQLIVRIEIREKHAYISKDNQKGSLGMPVGTAGEGMLLISGGIDSPVAGCMMAKRGLKLSAIHFASPPYTSKRALDKVYKLLSIMARYCGAIPLYIVKFTDIQEMLKKNCKEEYFTLLMRRMMVKVANDVSDNINNSYNKQIDCLVTGESLGQVASQTLKAIVCTENVSKRPILKPQIGMDKEEIIKIARQIDTYDTSILPYEDCCTIFTPKHPKTKPKLEEIANQEQKLDYKSLINQAVEDFEYRLVYPNWIL